MVKNLLSEGKDLPAWYRIQKKFPKNLKKFTKVPSWIIKILAKKPKDDVTGFPGV